MSARQFCFGLVLLATGCAQYQLGTRELFRPDVQTVYVPMVQSDDYRRYLGERLTEAIAKQIETVTPYKVVNGNSADSILNGRIFSTEKRVFAEDINDNPRDLEVSFSVQFTWVDQRGNQMMQPVTVPVPAVTMTLGQSAAFVPEAGQSITTAQQEAIERLARQIVSQMEAPW